MSAMQVVVGSAFTIAAFTLVVVVTYDGTSFNLFFGFRFSTSLASVVQSSAQLP